MKLSDAELGRQAAQQLWALGLDAVQVDDPLTPAFARSALAELELLEKGTPGVLREVLRGAQMSAEQLDIEPFHGLFEVVQNADDLGAREVRVAVQASQGRRRLLIVHDGDRVELRHVVAMTLAFVSTKRSDPRSKGRFGIGLKTLGRLGESLSVHSTPYHFAISGNAVHPIPARRSVAGFYAAQSSQTLLDLQLRPEVDIDAFVRWFEGIDSEALVFLDAVRSLQLVDLNRRKAVVNRRLIETGAEAVSLPGLNEVAIRTALREFRGNRSWERYEIEKKVPSSHRRRYKATGETTPIAIAIPNQPDGANTLSAGLPLGAATGLPVVLNAQFDIDVARRGVQHEALNEWLFAQLADLTAAVALDRLARDPVTAWAAIPLGLDETVAVDPWLADRATDYTKRIHKRLRVGFQLFVDGEHRRLREIAYEHVALEGLLSQSDVHHLREEVFLIPQRARDREGRWRAVLNELGEAAFVDVQKALTLLDWDDADLGIREAQWFIRMARAAIEAGLHATLWFQRSVLTSDGLRIVPPMPHVEGEILARSVPKESLAALLGLAHAIHPAYLSRWTVAVLVRSWLEDNDMLRDSPDPEGTLRALAARKQTDNVALGDRELRLLRDAFFEVDPRVREELGPAVGGAVTIEVQSWQGNNRVVGQARPSDSYLPASIDDRKDGWAKAAGNTPGLTWVHPRYQEVLRQAGREPTGTGRPRVLAAKAFFVLMGAEVAPRLQVPSHTESRYDVPAAPIDYSFLALSQREALMKLNRAASHLLGDRLSPDLLAVLQDLQRERGVRKRRVRARSLFVTLEREWSRLYASHTEATAVWTEWSWQKAGQIPSTWLAWARDEPWLTSQDRQHKAPRQLMIRTPVTESIFGDDRTSFAYELEASDVHSETALALGVEVDPQVSELIEQLARIRDKGGPVSSEAVSIRYMAIGAAITMRDPGPDDRIGDLTVRQLRARFGRRSNKTGLIYVAGRWLSPGSVFLGAPIFGQRRAFVSDTSHTRNLWRVLGVVPPSLSDCLDVLEELAGEPLDGDGDGDEDILVNTYQYIETILSDATASERGRLQKLPLWSGASWQSLRPVYLANDSDIARELGSHVKVWRIPVGMQAIPGMIASVGVTCLVESDFNAVIHETAYTVGAASERHFRAAVSLLRDWLSRHDRVLYEACSVSWEEFAGSRIAMDPELMLELSLGKGPPIILPARAHISLGPLTLYFADADAMSSDDAGGRVVAYLFGEGDRAKLALAWTNSVARAQRGEEGSVSLVSDYSDKNSLDALFDQASSTVIARRRNAAGRQPRTSLESGAVPPVRRLKSIGDLTDKAVLALSGESLAAAAKGDGARGLRDRLPEGRTIGGGQRAPSSAPLAYSSTEKQDLALEALLLAINGDFSELRDFSHLRGVGADALDKLGRFFEIKSFYGPLPDEVTMTANEADAAAREGDKFFLAVVAGLEEGYETVIKVIPDPVRRLHLKRNSSMTLTGITGPVPALEVRFSDEAAPK